MAKKPVNKQLSELRGVAQDVAQPELKLPKYIHRRGATFCFSRRAPAGLKPGTPIRLDTVDTAVGANGYIRFSLGTGTPADAAKLARKYTYLIDELADRLQVTSPKRVQPTTTAPIGNLTPTQIAHAADVMYATLLAADEGTAAASLSAVMAGRMSPEDEGVECCQTGDYWDLMAEAMLASDMSLREPDRYQWSSADLPPLTTVGQAELIQRLGNMASWYIYQTTGHTLSDITPELLPFATAFRKLVMDLERRRDGVNVPTPSPTFTPATYSWDEAFDYYFEQSPGLAPKTYANYRTAWYSLQKIAKCTPSELTRRHIIAWRENEQTRLSPVTVKNRLTFIKSIWQLNQVNEKFGTINENPFAGQKVKLDASEEPSREEFTLEEIKQLFAPPLLAKPSISAHAGYWLPLLALFHGARLTELTGLEVKDIVDSEHGLLMRIRPNSVRPRLKNQQSRRRVPIHPTVVEAGFDKYIAAARESGLLELWPSLTSGAKFGEAYVDFAAKRLNPDPELMVGMHCFRHSWETARRNGRLDASAANYLGGRTIDEGSAAIYGSEAGIPILLEELSRIEYKDLVIPEAPEVTAEMLKGDAVAKLRRKRRTPASKRLKAKS